MRPEEGSGNVRSRREVSLDQSNAQMVQSAALLREIQEVIDRLRRERYGF